MAKEADKCSLHETLAADIRKIKELVEQIHKRLGGGDVTFATLELRMAQLERVVYGAIGVAGVAFVLAVIGLVVKL